MPLITLLTDFGTSDPYVGEIKGVLASLAPSASLVDLTHHIAPGDLRAAAYILGRVWRRFPPGTIHLVVVDPGVGTARAALATGFDGHFFVGPDNGVLTPVLPPDGERPVALPTPVDAAPTFHGRDLFAPAAAALAEGRALLSLGARLGRAPERLIPAEPHHEGKSLVGEIVYVDRFGNLITNLTPETAPDYATFEVEDTDLGPLRRTFGDVPTGGLLAYLGSGGAVEIGVRDGSAARRLGIGVGGTVRARLG